MHKDPVIDRTAPGPAHRPSGDVAWRPAAFRGFPAALKPRGYLTGAIHVGGHYFSLVGL